MAIVDKAPAGGRHGRRGLVCAATVLASILGWASMSWACGFYGLPTAAVSPNRAAVAADVTVTGSGWQPEKAVALTLSPDGTSVMQSLGNATTDSDGRFTARVRLGDAATSGVYYLSAVQGSARSNTPIEVTGPAPSGASLLPTAGAWNSSALLEGPSLNDIGTHERPASAFPWAIVLVAGGLLALCAGLGVVELRRQRVRS
jgi:hypothetical protein